MRAVLLGGAPGVGKSTVAELVLARFADGTALVQWVDVDALWRHQPWRVDEATRGMLHANLSAVASSAARAGVEVLLVTWVFQSEAMHDVVREALPEHTATSTVQLRADEAAWRRRVAADPRRPPIDGFYLERYRGAEATVADHVVDTTALAPPEVAAAVHEAIGRLD